MEFGLQHVVYFYGFTEFKNFFDNFGIVKAFFDRSR